MSLGSTCGPTLLAMLVLGSGTPSSIHVTWWRPRMWSWSRTMYGPGPTSVILAIFVSGGFLLPVSRGCTDLDVCAGNRPVLDVVHNALNRAKNRSQRGGRDHYENRQP